MTIVVKGLFVESFCRWRIHLPVSASENITIRIADKSCTWAFKRSFPGSLPETSRLWDILWPLTWHYVHAASKCGYAPAKQEARPLEVPNATQRRAWNSASALIRIGLSFPWPLQHHKYTISKVCHHQTSSPESPTTAPYAMSLHICNPQHSLRKKHHVGYLYLPSWSQMRIM